MKEREKEEKKTQNLAAVTPCNDRSDSLSLYSNAHPMQLLAPCSMLQCAGHKTKKVTNGDI